MKWDEQLEVKVQALTPEQINAALGRQVDSAAPAIVETISNSLRVHPAQRLFPADDAIYGA
jgi:hypothetical protein